MKVMLIILVTFVIHGAVDATDLELPCFQYCPEVYDPVCGSNDETYNNDCELQADIICQRLDIKVKHRQACECHASCPEVYEPVCGSDGKTYRNECVFMKAHCWDRSLIKRADNACGWPRPCIQRCPEVFAPVCGSDDVTYVNECELQAAVHCKGAVVTKKHDQACECHVKCPSHSAPVCGTDDKTYANECFLKVATCWDRSLQKKKYGVCGAEWTYPFQPW